MRILAVDYGGKRIGVAVCDETETATRALPHVVRRGDEQAATDVAALARQELAAMIVVGLPRNADGTEGEAAAQARRFAARVAAKTEAAVSLADERWTTVEAERLLLAADRTRAQRRRQRDGVAASLLLESILEIRRAAAEPAANGGDGPMRESHE